MFANFSLFFTDFTFSRTILRYCQNTLKKKEEEECVKKWVVGIKIMIVFTYFFKTTVNTNALVIIERLTQQPVMEMI